MRPPLPEPNGDVGTWANNASLPSEAVVVLYRMTFASVARQTLKEIFFSVPSILVMLAVPFIVTAILLPVFQRGHRPPSSFEPTFLQLWVLSSGSHLLISLPPAFLSYLLQKKDRKLVLTPYGLAKHYKARVIETRWSSVLWIVSWNSDVLLCTFATQTFVPRGAFGSVQEAQEFIQIARQLHKSRGTAWREEWNGRIFGASA